MRAIDRPSRPRGFTLIEAMVALAVLLFGILGAMTGLIAASESVRSGQLQQYEAALLEAKAQRLFLANKVSGPYSLATLQTTSTNTSSFITTFGNLPEKIAIGAAPTPWVIDPTPYVAPTGTLFTDLGSGPLFKVLSNGSLTPDPTSVTSCLDTHVPAGDYCREIVVAPGTPPQNSTPVQTNALALPTGTTSYTVWIRVTRIVTPGTAPAPSSSVVYRAGFQQ